MPRVIENASIMSRIDYLSEGFRTGFLRLAERIVREENVKFNLIAGGLISYPAYRARLKGLTEQAIEEQKKKKAKEAEKPVEEREHLETLLQVRTRIREELPQTVAQELSEVMPHFVNRRGKPIKTYIMISPAGNYDGPIGAKIADELQKLREDIVFWDETSGRFPLKKMDRDFWVVLPDKAAWRALYYSTRPDRLVEDKARQTSQALPDFWITDCAAVSLIRPAGELSRPRITIPGLHKLHGITTSENQIGIRILDFTEEFVRIKTYSFKDFDSREREYIPDPKGASEMQKAIFREIRKSIPTIGMLEDALSWKRRTIRQAIDRYNADGLQPPIVLDGDPAKGKYNISLEWLQHKLRYRQPSLKGAKIDTLLGFACLHAGYTKTQYKYFVERVPELILQHDIRALLGVGDFIAGLKHNMNLRGEIYAGLNYTEQERLSAELVGGVMMRVFRARFDTSLARKKRTPSGKILVRMVEEALLSFHFIPGNHDKWVLDHGMEPLAEFRSYLKSLLVDGVHDHLAGHGLALRGVSRFVSDHLIYEFESELPSGLTLSMRHPEMGRMMTSSGRAQQTLRDAPGQVVVLANFHVAIEVLEWDQMLGQRVGLQIGTMVSGTDFESGKNKSVDTGVAMLRIWSHRGRIVATETIFDGPPKEDLLELDNRAIVDELLEELKLKTY